MDVYSGFSRARRIQDIEVSEIIRIVADANALRRQGRDVILLAAGEPDFPTPDNVKLAAIDAILSNQTRYTALDGTPALKAAIQEKFRRENGLSFALNEISVGPGAKQVLYNVLMATLDQGDEVVLTTPCWTSYLDMIRIAGGVPVTCPCAEDSAFLLTPEKLEAAITPRTRWLLLNSPANPTGAVYDGGALEALADVLRRHPHVGVICDDIYEHLVYDDARFVTMASVCPDLRDRTVTINGVSKSYSMTGWRIGFAGAPQPIIAAMAVVQSQSSSNPCSISQAAAAQALSGPQGVLAERRAVFCNRRSIVVDALNAMQGIHCLLPKGAFYAFASCQGLLDLPQVRAKGITTDSALCHYFLHAHEVAIVPGSCFALPGFFRISYAASDHDLKTAMARLATAVSQLVA
ncbi:pyridoxal phosphate-dependent aminotransferase [Komagataeibacter xylinus]|uniref:Aminotransferase n=1 Tax=Komagataeibacter xylinus TaxID=28448 RepID=A0A318PKG0_KOMXY|nr:pyridoxal phosphate-dependent aminotransferase [Komagataeibacter xylinus]PYD58064.1 pyridoxal phosphate-dependent aminotransferase [Komagataeibacter xylinus]GBQ67560.1 aspartate aminotransferase [Komagataeibacter xylinus NBRC 15237]